MGYLGHPPLNRPPSPPAQLASGDDLPGSARSTDGSNRTLTLIFAVRLLWPLSAGCSTERHDPPTSGKRHSIRTSADFCPRLFEFVDAYVKLSWMHSRNIPGVYRDIIALANTAKIHSPLQKAGAIIAPVLVWEYPAPRAVGYAALGMASRKQAFAS